MTTRRELLGTTAAFVLGACTRELPGGSTQTANAAPSSDTPTTAPVAADEKERALLAVLDDIDRTQREGNMIVPRDDGRLLRVLAAACAAKHVVEIGTSVGYSTLWLCMALRETGGKVTTYDIDEGRMTRARANFERAGVTSMITTVLGDAHVEVAKLQEPIDLLFIDADKPGYLDYLDKLLPRVRARGIVASHNMRFPTPDPKYVERITTDPKLETLMLNMDGPGIGVSLVKG